jgi:ABC-type uncharacterized transport system permease subunit
MQTQYTYANLLNTPLQSWYLLRPVLYRLLVLVVIILVSILFHHLASVALMAEGCNPGCAPLV